MNSVVKQRELTLHFLYQSLKKISLIRY